MTMPMWTDKAPFDNNDVRTALKKVVDREADGQDRAARLRRRRRRQPRAADALRTPGARRCRVPTSPARSKLLAKAGYNASNPLKVDIYTADMIPGIVNMVQLYKQQAAKAGIQVNVITGPPASTGTTSG